MTKKRVAMFVAMAVLAPIEGRSALAAAAPPAGGTISIDPHVAGPGNGALTASVVNAASKALASHAFTILEDADHAAYVAEVTVSQVEVGTGSARVQAGKAAIVPSGGGVVIPLSTGKSRLVPLQRTQLEIRIHRRGEAAAVWHGTATTVRAGGTPKGTDDAVATDLSTAVLSAYPAQPEGVVGVP